MPVNVRNVLILMFGLFLGVILALGQSVFADKTVNNSPYEGIPLDDIRTLSEVFGKIKKTMSKRLKTKYY